MVRMSGLEVSLGVNYETMCIIIKHYEKNL